MSERIFQVTHIGIVQQQVCTDAATAEEVVELANRLAPSGTELGWSIDEKAVPNPNECAKYDGRRHWMLVC